MQMETSENGSMPKSWTHHVKIDNSSTFKNGFKSKPPKVFVLLVFLTFNFRGSAIWIFFFLIQDDYSSTGGLCYGSRPSSLLMQNPQTRKVIVFCFFECLKTNRLL